MATFKVLSVNRVALCRCISSRRVCVKLSSLKLFAVVCGLMFPFEGLLVLTSAVSST